MQEEDKNLVDLIRTAMIPNEQPKKEELRDYAQDMKDRGLLDTPNMDPQL